MGPVVVGQVEKEESESMGREVGRIKGWMWGQRGGGQTGGAEEAEGVEVKPNEGPGRELVIADSG